MIDEEMMIDREKRFHQEKLCYQQSINPTLDAILHVPDRVFDIRNTSFCEERIRILQKGTVTLQTYRTGEQGVVGNPLSFVDCVALTIKTRSIAERLVPTIVALVSNHLL